jgi:hypothetical protein
MSSASEPLRASPPFIARRRLVRSGFQPDAYNQAVSGVAPITDLKK